MKKVLTGMLSALLASMGGNPTDTRSHIKPVPRLKDRNSPETVERMRADGQAKRARKAAKRQEVYNASIAFNPCHKVGKPSQTFLKYKAVPSRNPRRTGVFMEPIHPEPEQRW